MLAAAPGDLLGFRQIHFSRRKAGAFVCAVAERLGFGLPASAKIKRTDFHRQDIWGFLGNDCFTHASFVAVILL